MSAIIVGITPLFIELPSALVGRRVWGATFFLIIAIFSPSTFEEITADYFSSFVTTQEQLAALIGAFLFFYLVILIHNAVVSRVFPGFIMGTITKYLSLRFLLFRSDHVPIRYDKFLDYCANLMLMRKVGRSYMFIHPLIQKHFVKKYSEDKNLQDKGALKFKLQIF